MKSLSLLFASAFCATTCFAQTKADSLKVATIFNKSKDAYAHLKTYVDSGKVIRTMISDHTSKTAMVFKTAYTSTGGFNFDAYKTGQSNSLYTVNRTANIIKTWWGITDKEAGAVSISEAMAGVVGASSGDAMLVPQLLMSADFRGASVFRVLKHCSLAPEEKVNGKDCYLIKGDGMSGITKMWIAKNDFLIRKIETERVVDPVKVEANTRRIADELKKKDSVKYAGAIKASKLLADINKRDSMMGKPKHPFTVKESYTLVPVVDHAVNPVLLKFRPNREVAL